MSVKGELMSCCGQCQGIESLFDQGIAHRELKHYRKKGPAKETRMLLDVLRDSDIEAATLLDIGGGIGAIQHELAREGVRQVIGVDASTAYLEAARTEAERQGYADRAQYIHGDFVDIAPNIEAADIVTLDRVLCCYHDMKTLVGLSAARAGKIYGVVFPQDTWWMRVGFSVINAFQRLRRHPFRVFVHQTQAVDALLGEMGFEKCYHRHTLLWQVVVYERST
jgi:magnesium-protoporphyrin O-methyltransferase